MGLPESVLFCMMDKGPRGMFWTKVAQFGPTGTPRKSAFFQERGRKRMKEWHQVTFTKEWMNALDDTRILAPTHLKYLVSFPRYGRLKKKCWYKQVCNGTYWLLLTAHFGPVFIRPSQWSITAVKIVLIFASTTAAVQYASPGGIALVTDALNPHYTTLHYSALQ